MATVVVTTLGFAISGVHQFVGSAVVLTLVMGGVLVAAVGYVDDRLGLSALPRFFVHALAAVVAVILLGDTKPVFSALPQLVSSAILLLGVIWSVNLFNFMDGIDGIAASQAVFMSASFAVLILLTEGDTVWVAISALTAGSSLGFLIWNWPPAKIFMGDVGSGFLGYWLAVLAIGLHVYGNLSIWTSVVLGSVFIADATTTLLRRIVRGERWYEAHRSHAYQHLAQRWASHLKVTGLVWVINIALVLPLAYASTVWAEAAVGIAFGLLFVLSLGCLALGAGKPAK